METDRAGEKVLRMRLSMILIGMACVGAAAASSSGHAPVPNVGRDADSLVVVTWNVEWFGHAGYPPANDALQIINVAEVLRATRADVYALQEIASEGAFHQLLTMLGSPYVGILSSSGSPQRLAFVYNADVLRGVQVLDREFTPHSHSFANRLPLILHGKPGVGDQEVPWTFITVHMKAFFDADSRARRALAAVALKEYTDSRVARSRLVVLGDFNDDFTYSIGGGESPYASLLLDTIRYYVPTATLSVANGYTYCGNADCTSGSVIDHVLTGRNLEPYVSGIERMENLLSTVPAFVSTTSDHLPLRVAFHLARSHGPPAAGIGRQAIVMGPPFPHPFGARLTVPIEVASSGWMDLAAIDLLGRTQSLLNATLWLEAGGHHVTVDTRHLAPGPRVLCAIIMSERTCRTVVKVR